MKKKKQKEFAFPKIELPDGILTTDLDYSSPRVKWAYDKQSGLRIQFEVWKIQNIGWVIPTLLIRRPGRRHSSNVERTYATGLDGKTYRVGLGPHVLARQTIYVKASRLAALQKFVDLQNAGEVNANVIRDRISSRRAQSQLRRDPFGGY